MTVAELTEGEDTVWVSVWVAVLTADLVVVTVVTPVLVTLAGTVVVNETTCVVGRD